VKYQVNLFSEKLTLSQERPQITTNKLNTVIGLKIRTGRNKISQDDLVNRLWSLSADRELVMLQKSLR
jgi:hypothetical protein